MKSGDAKILRNAGARVTEDVLRTLVLATYLLGVKKILVMPHTNCRMASAEEADIHAHIQSEFGVDTRSLEFRTVKDQEKALALDVSRIRAFPFLNKDVVVGCNSENASYGVGLCAECGLISSLTATGGGRLIAVVCVDGKGEYLSPCGRCRQLLFEHGGNEMLFMTPEGAKPLSYLLPWGFGPEDLK